jgi:hypothetical protein
MEFLDWWKAAKVELSMPVLLMKIRTALLRSEEGACQTLERCGCFYVYTNSRVEILKKIVDSTIKSALVFDANCNS